MIDMKLHAFTDLTDSALAELSQYEGLEHILRETVFPAEVTFSLLSLVFVPTASSIDPLHFIHAAAFSFCHLLTLAISYSRLREYQVLVGIEVARLAVIPQTIAPIRLSVEGGERFLDPALDTAL